MNEAGDRERAIFDAASKLSPRERAAFLDTACGCDERLRQRIIEALYQASAKSGPAGVADQPPPPVRGTIAVVPPDDPPGEKSRDLIGPYHLLEKLGEGGMGSVWVAEQREPIRRKVALKVIKLGMDTKQVIARFEAERQVLAWMDHPNIAKVLDAGVTDKGRPYFVMELVSGTRITDYCDLHNVPTRQRLELFVQVCHAIAHAHEKGIIHRDLKPPNILVALHNNAPAPRIIDFGIAKAIGGQRPTDKTIYTTLEEFIGTPAYMSPEQAEMNPLGVDARTDIYSLGVLLYELLTGLTPFETERFHRLGLDEIRRIIREEEPPRPSTRLTTLHADHRAALARHHQCDAPKLLHLVRGDLDWIVMKCLEKDRTRRYQTAAELAADVERYLEGEPIDARPPSTVYKLSKLVRRNKGPLTAAAATFGLACVALMITAFAWPALFARRSLGADELAAGADRFLEHYDATGAISNAIAGLKAALRSEPRNARLWGRVGWAKWLQFEEDQREETRIEAFQCASNAVSLIDRNPEGHLVMGLVSGQVRDWHEATNHLLAANQITRSANPIVLLSLAAVLQAQGDVRHANEFADLAEQAAGANWDAFDRLGIFFKSDARDIGHQRSRKSFERAIELAPKSPLAHRNLGQILLKQGRPDLAISQLERSLKLRRTAAALSNMGSVHLAQYRFGASADYFCEASSMDPLKYLYHVNAALALRNLPDRLREATNHFEQALRQTRDFQASSAEKPLTRAYQGMCEAGLAKTVEARASLEKALTDAGGDAHVLEVISRGFRVLGDLQRADEVQALAKKGHTASDSI